MTIQADMHTHTIASTHAYSTILENCQWAEINGVKAVAMTDHTMAMPDSPHIWHFENLRMVPRKIGNTIVLRGAETNIIDFDGNLDVDENFLKNMEWVVCSMHKQTMPTGTPQEIAKAYINIMKNPYVDLIAHSTTFYFQCDFEMLVKGAVEYDKLIEINESSINVKSGSRENCYELLKLCEKYGAKVCVDTDSHFCQQIGKATSAFKILEECNFPEKLVINSDWNVLREWILKKRPYLDI